MATCMLQLERRAEAEALLQRVVSMHESLPDGKLSTTYLLAAHYLSMCVPRYLISLAPSFIHTCITAFRAHLSDCLRIRVMWGKLNSSILSQHAFSECVLLHPSCCPLAPAFALFFCLFYF